MKKMPAKTLNSIVLVFLLKRQYHFDKIDIKS